MRGLLSKMGLDANLLDGGASSGSSITLSVGDTVIASSDAVNYNYSYRYDWQKEIRINYGGSIRVKFDLEDYNGSGDVYGRIYINGIARGIERVTSSGSFITYTEDFTGLKANDLIQLYVYRSSSNCIATYQNFRICASTLPLCTVNR